MIEVARKSEEELKELFQDYEAMKNMIYGPKPEFDEIIECLKNLEKEIHQL